MDENSMDLLELLRKRGMDGDVDFLREAFRVDDLVKALGCDGISKSRVSRICRTWTRWWRTSWAGPWMVAPTPTCGWTP